MIRNRGCGCLLIVLAIMNLMLTFSCIYFAISPPTSTGTPRPVLYVFAAMLFASNVVASAMLGLGAVRGARAARAPDEEELETADGSEVVEEERQDNTADDE